MEQKKKKKGSIIFLVAFLFFISIIVTGLATYVTEMTFYRNSVREQTEYQAADIANEVRAAVREFASYEWLIRYWYNHASELDVEYDVEYVADTKTAGKSRELLKRHPGLDFKYLTAGEARLLPEEDQKLYAEVAYSWLLTRANEIKQAYKVDYLFTVVSEEPFTSQVFLFSAAEPGAVRGTSYEEAYLVGHTVTVGESQSEAMRSAMQTSNHLASAGEYMDYYAWLHRFDGHQVLIGLTYNLSRLQSDVQAKTVTGTTMAVINQILLALICLALILFFVILPVRKVQHSIRGYKASKDSGMVVADLSRVRNRNEIGELAEDVSDMVSELDAHMNEIQVITAEKERIGTELQLATRIQAAMLPSRFPAFPDRSEFDLHAVMDPAKEVGGDFYDFFLIDDDHLGLVIADVSGKGIPAALFMAISKVLVKNYVMIGRSPAESLESINRQITAGNREEMFVTVWLGILEISTGRLTTANAGHEYPVIKQPDGSYELFKDRHGLVIGAMDGVRYKNEEVLLKPGARIFVYTDGVPEATSAENELFGTNRLLEALNADPEASPEQVMKNVRSAVDAFVKDAEQFDDLTMLSLEYRGPARHA